MPTISVFYGILIQMYWQDHEPAHFHVRYGGDQAVIAIESLQMMRGRLPGRALELVREWAEMHRDELWEDWKLCQAKQTPKPIEPLK
jgi:Domain of unknown function (DUF4160)